MTKYKLAQDGKSILRDDGAFIPADPANTDYTDFLAWQAQGNTAAPADVVSPNDAIQAQIDGLERGAMLNRGSRELELRLMESEAATLAATNNTTAAALLSAQPYYVKLKALDNQIVALRAQLK